MKIYDISDIDFEKEKPMSVRFEQIPEYQVTVKDKNGHEYHIGYVRQNWDGASFYFDPYESVEDIGKLDKNVCLINTGLMKHLGYYTDDCGDYVPGVPVYFDTIEEAKNAVIDYGIKLTTKFNQDA